MILPESNKQPQPKRSLCGGWCGLFLILSMLAVAVFTLLVVVNGG